MERHISAATLASQVASGQISAVELVCERLELVQRLNPGLNALVVARAEAALADAAAIDQARLRGEPLGPLAGVPITIKEALDVQGLPSTGGLRQRAAHRADSDCAAVARLRGAGAVILGKSNLAQAMVFIESDNPHYGRCQHPERADRSPGGSSGGEGALIASGISSLGLGTDIGGSARIPAAFCGVCGLKPTAGRLPDPQRLSLPVGQIAIPSQLSPMAGVVSDLDLMLQVLDPSWSDPTRRAQVDMHRLRIGVYTHDGVFRASPGVRRAVEQAAAALRAAGATVVPFAIPEPLHAHALYYGLLSADGTAGLRRLLRGGPSDARVAQLLMIGARSRATRTVLAALAAGLGQAHLARMLRALGRRSVDAYWTLCAAQQDYTERFAAAMDACAGGALDLLLGPAVATPAFTHGAAKFLGVPGIYTTLYNLLGWPAGVVPVTRVQAGEESDRPKSLDIAERTARMVEQGSAGLPIGVQIAGRPWREEQVLAAMAAIESACAYT